MLIYTYEYDSAYDGPALPVVDIEISSPDLGENRSVIRALVDSGADATMIPVHHLQRVRALLMDRRRIRDTANISYLVDTYSIALKVGPFFHRDLEVIANRQSNDVILGRDILNHMIVTLNGLAYVVELSN